LLERNPSVHRSLSVLLPVQDAQATLQKSVHAILDDMADSRERFELLIIDDGSTDATSEVAHELSRRYPQIRLIRHSRPMGRAASIRSGLEWSRGDVVVMRDDRRGYCVVERSAQSAADKPARSRPARPNFLGRVKSFALGE